MRTAILILLVLAVSTFSGCIPWIQKAEGCAIKGRLVDQATGQPVANSHVTIRADDVEYKKKTAADGTFEVPPEWDLYCVWSFWTWYACGPIDIIATPQAHKLRKGLPNMVGPLSLGPPRVIEITTRGYSPFKIEADLKATSAPANWAYAVVKDQAIILLGDLRIKRVVRP